MQRIGGLVLIFSGIALGGYTFLPPPFDGEQALREMTRISAAPDRSVDTSTPEAGGGGLYAGQNLAAVGPVALRLETGAVNKPSVTWSAIVTAAPAQGRITSSKPGDRRTRVQLTRDLQTELKRVGCYGGEITGSWTQSTKRAMRAFMDRVNATLPIEDPDYILLSLVQGHADQACGPGCPAGQTVSESGRCLPKTVVAARAARQNSRSASVEPGAATVHIAAQRPSGYDRRAAAPSAAKAPVLISGPKLVASRTPTVRTADKKLAEKKIALQTQPEVLPWQNERSPSRRRVNRPDGMMGVGGPRQFDATVPPASATITPPRGSVRIVTLDAEVDHPRDVGGAAPVLNERRKYAEPEDALEPDRPVKQPRAASQGKRSKSAKRNARKSAPSQAKRSKNKYYDYADNRPRRGFPRRSSPAYIMLQAMGGIF